MAPSLNAQDFKLLGRRHFYHNLIHNNGVSPAETAGHNHETFINSSVFYSTLLHSLFLHLVFAETFLQK